MRVRGAGMLRQSMAAAPAGGAQGSGRARTCPPPSTPAASESCTAWGPGGATFMYPGPFQVTSGQGEGAGALASDSRDDTQAARFPMGACTLRSASDRMMLAFWAAAWLMAPAAGVVCRAGCLGGDDGSGVWGCMPPPARIADWVRGRRGMPRTKSAPGCLIACTTPLGPRRTLEGVGEGRVAPDARDHGVQRDGRGGDGVGAQEGLVDEVGGGGQGIARHGVRQGQAVGLAHLADGGGGQGEDAACREGWG